MATERVLRRAASFDDQADVFDRRAGLPPRAVAGVAAAVAEICPPETAGTLLDLGAGTGELGVRLAAGRAAYLGLDLSLAMLRVFRGRPGGRAVPLTAADASRGWPVRRGSVAAIFASRAAHRLPVEHLANEALRVARPTGAWVILGRVRRERASVRAAMRRRMRRLLADHGLEGRSADRTHRRLSGLLEGRGGQTEPARVVATWPVVERPADALAAWRSKPGLAGTALAAEIQVAVLDELTAWARQRYGDLDTIRETRESYELTPIRLPDGAPPGDS